MSENLNEKSRTIYIGGEINSASARDLITGLHTLGLKNNKLVTILINSQGGSADDGLAMHDAIVTASFPTVGVVYGVCASSAFTVLQACSIRLASPNSMLMFHDGTAGIVRSHMLETVSTAKAIARDVDNYHALIARRTGHAKKQIKEMSRFSKYMTAAEALEQKFIDGLLVPKGTKGAKKLARVKRA